MQNIFREKIFLVGHSSEISDFVFSGLKTRKLHQLASQMARILISKKYDFIHELRDASVDLAFLVFEEKSDLKADD